MSTLRRLPLAFAVGTPLPDALAALLLLVLVTAWLCVLLTDGDPPAWEPYQERVPARRPRRLPKGAPVPAP